MNEEERIKYFDIGIKFRGGAFPKGTTWDSLNEEHGNPFSSGESWRNFVRRELKKQEMLLPNKNGDNPSAPERKSTIELNKDGTQTSTRLIEMAEEDAKDKNFLLQAHGYDVGMWEITSARNNIWQVYSKEDKVQTLYSSRIVVKPRSTVSLDEVKEVFAELDREYEPPIHKPTQYDKNGKMLEINLADLHLGKLAWVGDAGENYDYKIARDRFFYVINDVLTRTAHYKFNKILFVFSNDFYHFDNLDTTTTSGTRMDSDLRWAKLYKVGVEMLIEGIDLLSQHAPVETFYLGSNHDKMTSFYAVCHLDAWFRHNKNININTDAQARKYIEFGRCLIGFTHGDTERKSRIGKLMPIEAREAWGRTLYHEVHAAHFHSEQAIKEENGIIVRHISSPTGTDNWHYEKGFVGAVKKTQSFIWDKELGLTDIIHTAIPMAPPQG